MAIIWVGQQTVISYYNKAVFYFGEKKQTMLETKRHCGSFIFMWVGATEDLLDLIINLSLFLHFTSQNSDISLKTFPKRKKGGKLSRQRLQNGGVQYSSKCWINLVLYFALSCSDVTS